MYTSFAQAHQTCVHMLVERAGRCQMARRLDDSLSAAEARRQVHLEMAEYVRAVGSECMNTWFEVRLAGTDEIQPRAQDVVDAVNQLMSIDDLDGRDTDEALAKVNDVIDSFIAACRAELWYTPRWWQVHRRAGRSAARLWRRLRRSPQGGDHEGRAGLTTSETPGSARR